MLLTGLFQIIVPILYFIAAIIGYGRIQTPKEPPSKLQSVFGILITGCKRSGGKSLMNL